MGRGGQCLNPALDAGVEGVDPHQEGEPVGMAQRRRLSIGSDVAESTVGQAIARLRRSVVGPRQVFVEQHALDALRVHDRQRDFGAQHIGVHLRVDDVHGSSRF